MNAKCEWGIENEVIILIKCDWSIADATMDLPCLKESIIFLEFHNECIDKGLGSKCNAMIITTRVEMADHFDNNNTFVHAIQFLFNYAKAFLIWCTHNRTQAIESEMRTERCEKNDVTVMVVCRWKALTQSNRYAIIYSEKVLISHCVVITVSHTHARAYTATGCQRCAIEPSVYAEYSAALVLKHRYFNIFYQKIPNEWLHCVAFSLYSSVICIICFCCCSQNEKVKLHIFAHASFQICNGNDEKVQEVNDDECETTCYHNMVSTSTDFEMQMKNFFCVCNQTGKESTSSSPISMHILLRLPKGLWRYYYLVFDIWFQL